MPRKGYLNVYVQEGSPREAQLNELCDRLGLDRSHRSRLAAIDAALAVALVKVDITEKGEG